MIDLSLKIILGEILKKKRYKLEIAFYILFNGCSMWKSVFDLMLTCTHRVVCHSNYIVLTYKQTATVNT